MMKELTLEETRQIQIQILNIVDDYCTKKHITYWLDSGTLIGAVRHGGYIPWDDDIDLGMFRTDYDRLMHGFNAVNPRYQLRCVENDPDFCYVQGKVLDLSTVLFEPDLNGEKLAVNIDIFVYDNAPDDPALVRALYDRRDKLRNWNSRRNYKGKIPGSVIRRVASRTLRTVIKVFPKGYYLRKLALNAKTYADQETKALGNFQGYSRPIIDKQLLADFTPHLFEGRYYPIPTRYSEYLDLFYIKYNFRELPPPEKRVSHHSFRAFLAESSSVSSAEGGSNDKGE